MSRRTSARAEENPQSVCPHRRAPGCCDACRHLAETGIKIKVNNRPDLRHEMKFSLD